MKWWALALTLAVSAGQRAPASNATITGVVAQFKGDLPIEGVTVELKAEKLATASLNVEAREVVTDESGRFEFRNLPPGRYRVYWKRSGYFHPKLVEAGGSSDDEYGAAGSRSSPNLNVYDWRNRARARSIVVDVAQNQARSIALTLVPGGVITGRVLDGRGRPLSGGKIEGFPIAYYEAGDPVLLETGYSAVVDDRGDFRLFGLQPGKYYVRVDNWPIKGPNGEESARYSYFPGGTAATATPITVSSGAESRGVDFTLLGEPTATISGTVAIAVPGFKLREEPGPGGIGTKTWPPILYFFAMPSGRGLQDPARMQFRNAVSNDADRLAGKFELRDVPYGDYNLYALLRNDDNTLSAADFFAGRVAISVRTPAIQNLSMEVGLGNRIEGRVILKDGAKLAPGTKMHVRLRPDAAVFPSVDALQEWGESVRSDGTFEISGLVDHRYRVTLTGPEDSVVADIRQDGRSVYDSGVVVRNRTEAIEIIVSGDAGSVQVNVRDENRQPVAGATVALVPAIERRGNAALHRVIQFDTEQSRYSPLRGVLPGEYTLFAWDSLPEGAELSADFLNAFENRGVRVVVRGKQTVTVDVPLIVTE